MTLAKHQHGWVIVVSFLVAYLLTIVPTPSWANLLHPEWSLLVLIFWALNLPDRVGVGVGWLVGLFLDVLTAGLMGQNALSFAILAYLTAKLHLRVRLFPWWQQALTLLLLLTLHQLFIIWIDRFIGVPPGTRWFWVPPIAGALCWPLVAFTLQIIKTRYRVN